MKMGVTMENHKCGSRSLRIVARAISDCTLISGADLGRKEISADSEIVMVDLASNKIGRVTTLGRPFQTFRILTEM